MAIQYIIPGEVDEVAVRASLYINGMGQWVALIEQCGCRVLVAADDSAAVAVNRMISMLATTKLWLQGIDMPGVEVTQLYKLARDQYFAMCQLERILIPDGPCFSQWSPEDLRAFKVPTSLIG